MPFFAFLRRACTRLAELGAFVLVLLLCLDIVDLPKLEVYPDATLKTLRYPDVDNVYRDEDYSRYHVNSYGLVGDEPAPPSDTGVYRIAVFGDSFIEALQVPQSYKFTTLLEAAIAPPAGRRKVELWNFGHSADNTGNEYARFVNRRPDVSFDLVLFTFNEADLLEDRPQDSRDKSGSFLVDDGQGGFRLVHDSAASAGERMPWLNRTFPRFHNFHLQLRGRVADYVRDMPAAVGRRIAGLTGRRPSSPESAAAGPTISAEQIDSGFAQLLFVAGAIRQSGVPVVLVGLPTDAAAPAGFSSHRMDANRAYIDLAHRLAQSGVAFVDTYPLVAAEIAKGHDPYSDWEPVHHFNRVGHRVIAQAIGDYLDLHKELGLAVRTGKADEARH